MLNYETLLSSYDDKLTLMQWLKKVEAALKDASAVSFKVNKRGDATLTFSVVFEDGSEIESNEIILQQGESVQAATIRNGHLILTLTNGDELDAGDLGGVSGFSIDASQHLIVTYQNGATQDLGAIFSGNVVIGGNLEVTGLATLPYIEGDENGDINVDGDIVISDGGISIADGAVSTPILTSANEQIEAQKPVVEVMEGYAATLGTNAAFRITNVYNGAVKNGNKLTIVSAVKLTRTATATGNLQIVAFTIPSNIGNKLYPVPIGGYNWGLAYMPISAMSTIQTGVTQNAYIEKENNTTLRIFLLNAATLNNLQEGVEYYVRIEATFLLSENLVA